ncbi:MAG: SGNH/GDSL hydrolase family protein, partial [Planctomycetes bacterium]|nr:SGNH/GDSL hydrolase family protein [Planctomycetota bacterium]
MPRNKKSTDPSEGDASGEENRTLSVPAETGRKPGGGFFLKIGMLLGSVLITLLICEGAFRVAGISGQYLKQRVDTLIPREGGPVNRVPHGFVPYSIMRSRYDTDPRGYFDEGCILDHRFNSVGWRDDEHPIEKPPGTYRILGLGDSYTFGQGVRHEDLCLTLLESLLREKNTGLRFETINAGMSAYNTGNERDLLEEKGLSYDPDLVIVFFVPNDLEDDVFRKGPKIVFYTDYTNTYMNEDFLSGYSNLWSWLRQKYLRSTRGKAYIDDCLKIFRENDEKWMLCRYAVKDIQRLCEKNDVRLLVVIYPFFYDLDGENPFKPIHDLMTDFCKKEGIHVLDLLE